MTRHEALALLAQLDLPAEDVAVHGSGAMLLRGLLDEVRDLDLVARGAAWERVRALHAVERGDVDPVVRPLPGVEVWGGWFGEDVDALIARAEPIDGWRCVDLRAVLAFKERLDRPKDRAHAALLRAHLDDRDGPDVDTPASAC